MIGDLHGRVVTPALIAENPVDSRPAPAVQTGAGPVNRGLTVATVTKATARRARPSRVKSKPINWPRISDGS